MKRGEKMRINGKKINNYLEQIEFNDDYRNVARVYGFDLYFPDRNPERENYIRINGTKFLSLDASYEFLFENNVLNKIEISISPTDNKKKKPEEIIEILKEKLNIKKEDELPDSKIEKNLNCVLVTLTK